MATRIKIFGRPKLKHAYNVTQHVGPSRPNLADDVQLVQFMIAELVKISDNRGKKQGLPVPMPTGRFDITLAYWIFETQYQKEADETGADIDGVISPMRGNTILYSGNKSWTIGRINEAFQQLLPDKFDNLHLEPSLSPSLRAAIAPK